MLTQHRCNIGNPFGANQQVGLLPVQDDHDAHTVYMKAIEIDVINKLNHTLFVNPSHHSAGHRFDPATHYFSHRGRATHQPHLHTVKVHYRPLAYTRLLGS